MKVYAFIGSNIAYAGYKQTILAGPNTIRVHKKYDGFHISNDIGLLKTNRIKYSSIIMFSADLFLTFNFALDSVQKINFPKGNGFFRKNYDGRKCYITGWGSTDRHRNYCAFRLTRINLTIS